ncbi:DNA-binding protein [Burkholderia cepacia]|uniref:DNA-binding protein n=1 Tax=Burkholderia cepacia TaxID=292 RepID=UPI003EDFF4D8
MARAGLTRTEVKRARDSLIAQGQHASVDAIRVALGNTGSKTTIHRYLKELEEAEGASLMRMASLSDAIQDLVARLAARLHEEAQARVDQHAAAAAAQRQQAQAEIAKLNGELAALRAHLTNATAALSSEQDAHADHVWRHSSARSTSNDWRSRCTTRPCGWPNTKASASRSRRS